MQITYLGHSAFHIGSDGFSALIDPFLTGNPNASEGPEARGGVDYIFVTHAHGDHLGDAVAIAKRTGAQVFATNELAKYLSGKGLKTIGMHIGGRASFPFGRVKLTTATHGSSVIEDGVVVCADLPCGYLIELEGKKVYHAGDSGLTSDMALLVEEKVDVALLPIGGFYVMDPEDAARAVGMIKPAVVVPMHYGTFPPISGKPSDFEKALLARGGMDVRVEVMQAGGTLTL